MKIAALAIAALFGVADAKKITSKDLKTLQSRAQKGKVNKQTLMRGATPYSPAAKRKMEEAEEWEINGYYSVEFDNCLSLKTANENLFDEDMVYYAANGLVTSATSYITFTVCETKNCYYQTDDQKMTFITDIATYFQALAEYLPNQVKQYCEGCEDNEDYCKGNLEQEDEQEDEKEDEEEESQEDEESQDEDRKLAHKPNRRRLGNQRVVEYINCNQCEAYQCFEDDEEDRKLEEEQVYDMDGAVEWITELAECKELEDVTYGDDANPYYAGLMCNDKGNGVEIAVFMDDECSLYTTAKSFADVMSYDDKQYFYMSQEIVQYTFTNAFDCENIEIEYTNPYQENQDEQEEEEDDGEAPEAAEYCQDLFDETVDMYDCGVDQDADEDEEQQDEDAYMANYEWYNYELTQDQADDAQAVCKVLNGWDMDAGKSKSYQGKTVYDSSSSGTLYTYKRGKNSNKSSGGAGSIVAIVLFALVVVGAVGFFVFQKKSNDSKKAPLISANNNGQMA